MGLGKEHERKTIAERFFVARFICERDETNSERNQRVVASDNRAKIAKRGREKKN